MKPSAETDSCPQSGAGKAYVRLAATVVALLVLIGGLVVLFKWRTAGNAEVKTVTKRFAEAIALGDEKALADEPLLKNHQHTVSWLVQRHSALAMGYRIDVKRNGADGFQLMDPEVVSHLGVIQTSSGTVSLGFRRDDETGDLEFVSASASGVLGSPGTEPHGRITTPNDEP